MLRSKKLKLDRPRECDRLSKIAGGKIVKLDITVSSPNGPVRYSSDTATPRDLERIAAAHGIVLYCEVPPQLLREETSFSARVDALRGLQAL